jgi:hypothetical protein
MSFTKMLVGAALTLSMAPLAARADDFSQQQYQQPQYDQQYQYQQPQPVYPQEPGIAVGEPTPYGRGGHYEQRAVQRWVPGQYQQVWVPQQCTTRYMQRGWYRTAANVCVPGHYDQQWTAGHYETIQQQVWVPHGFRHHHRWGWSFSNRGI